MSVECWQYALFSQWEQTTPVATFTDRMVLSICHCWHLHLFKLRAPPCLVLPPGIWKTFLFGFGEDLHLCWTFMDVEKKKKKTYEARNECVHIDLTNHGWNLAAALRGEGPHDSDAGISASFFPMNTHISSACEMEKCASTAGCSGPLHY